MFAAIGLAYQNKKPAIWAINTSDDNASTFEIADLRTRNGRDQEQIKHDSEKAKRCTAAHQAHITGCLTHKNYTTIPNTDATEIPTPIFTLTDSMWKDDSDGTTGKGPSKKFNPTSTWEFRTLATETLDRLSRTGIREISAAADALKDTITRAPPRTETPIRTALQSLWPNHEGLFGASDASRNNPHEAILATDEESKKFSRTMQQETKTTTTTPRPHLDLAAFFKENTANTEQVLSNTVTHGLFWIYYHKGITRISGRHTRTAAPGWFLCTAHQSTPGPQKSATVRYNILQHPCDQDTQVAINASRLTQNGDITTSATPWQIKDLTSDPELEQETTTQNFLELMTTVSAGPPLGEEAILQDLTQPPEIAPLKTLDGLRTEARNLTEEKILTLPQLNQAALLAGTGITPNELITFVALTRNTT